MQFDGHPCLEIWVFPIWAELEIRTAGNLSPDNGAPELQAGIVFGQQKQFGWREDEDGLQALGGGTQLGSIDHDSHPSFRMAYAAGKVEAVAHIQPPSLVDYFHYGHTWKMQREVVKEHVWDNGGKTILNPAAQSPDELLWEEGVLVLSGDDTSNPNNLDLDPYDHLIRGKLFDVDSPGCSPVRYLSIRHTCEVYINFNQWVAVVIDGESVPCSEVKPWSYESQVDIDRPVGQRVLRNSVKSLHIEIPDTKTFATRMP